MSIEIEEINKKINKLTLQYSKDHKESIRKEILVLQDFKITLEKIKSCYNVKNK